MDVDMTLDDMIAAKPKAGRRRGGGRVGGAGRATAPAAPAPAAAPAAARGRGSARARYSGGAVPQGNNAGVAARQAQAAAAIQQGGTGGGAGEAFKIIVSNLPLDVDDAAVRDLFQSTVGPTGECFLAYDKNGKHKGVATVVFKRKGDAQKAFKEYNNRLIDGRTPMKVELVFSKPPATQSLSQRVAPVAPAAAAAAPAVASSAAGAASGGRRPRGAAANGGGGRKAGSGRRPPKTQAELDAEMDTWASKPAGTVPEPTV